MITKARHHPSHAAIQRSQPHEKRRHRRGRRHDGARLRHLNHQHGRPPIGRPSSANRNSRRTSSSRSCSISPIWRCPCSTPTPISAASAPTTWRDQVAHREGFVEGGYRPYRNTFRDLGIDDRPMLVHVTAGTPVDAAGLAGRPHRVHRRRRCHEFDASATRGRSSCANSTRRCRDGQLAIAYERRGSADKADVETSKCAGIR